MITLADLNRAVQSVLSSKRLGQPVFVRLSVQRFEDDRPAFDRLVQLTGVVAGWLGQRLHAVHALAVEPGSVNLTLQFSTGGSAIISYVRTRPIGDGVDLLLLGNQGAVYRDWFAGDSPGNADGFFLPDDPPAGTRLREAIQRALKSGRVEPVGEERTP